MYAGIFKRRMFVGITALAIFLAVSCASEEDGVPPAVSQDQRAPTPTPAISDEDGVTTVIVHLSPTEGDGQIGTATFASDGTSTTVEIEVSPAATEAQPIHIHAGVCDDVGTVIHALQNVVKGKSSTEIDLPIDSVLSGEALVNVHASYTDASTYTACGQLPSSIGN